ncbi:MAG: L-threonylcarbamoyladenylate synthase [Candidatus Omnitrophica bacterium]|nr:L-threonylcarbamoyladenylate synthase [Candidatus Omnitrophota bacterium]
MITQVLKIDPVNPQVEYLVRAAEVLKEGGIIAFPTETVYGLGANFFDKKALDKLYEIKRRPKDKPFTVHIADLKDMEAFECEAPPFAKELIEKFWPGPLTLIFDTAASGKTGIRMPNSAIARELVRQSGILLAGPSANVSGLAPARDAMEVLKQFKDKIELILDGGETVLGKESTVIDLTILPYKITRIGAISKEKIAELEFNFWKNIQGPAIKKILFVCTGNSCRSAMAEGYLKKRLGEVERDDIEVVSRGIVASSLLHPTIEALDVLKADKIDMSPHRPTVLADDDIKSADLILVMEEFHRDEIIERLPSKKDKVYLLAEFGLWGGRAQNTPLEIQDPIGKSGGVYRDVYGIMKNSIERLVKILI